MWVVLISSLFLAISGGSTALEKCKMHVSYYCEEPSSLYKIPRNSTLLLSLCPEWKEYLNCLHLYDKGCKDARYVFHGIKPPLKYESLDKILDEVCDERSQLYRTIGLHLDCINRSIEGLCEKCPATSIVYRAYTKTLPLHKKNDNSHKKECLRTMAILICGVHNINKHCGYQAYREVDRILTETKIFTSFCQDLKTVQELLSELDYMTLDATLKDNLRKYLAVN